jgi:hypothetical protein
VADLLGNDESMAKLKQKRTKKIFKNIDKVRNEIAKSSIGFEVKGGKR